MIGSYVFKIVSGFLQINIHEKNFKTWKRTELTWPISCGTTSDSTAKTQEDRELGVPKGDNRGVTMKK